LGDYAELATKIEQLNHLLTHCADQLDQFLVVTRRSVRVRPTPGEQELSTFWAGG